MQTCQSQTEKTAIVLSQVVTSPERIVVASDASSTLWIDEMPVTKHVAIDVDQGGQAMGKALLARSTEIFRQAKRQGVSVKRGVGVNRQIKDVVPTLDDAIATAKSLYAQLQAGWEAKCAKGIFSGYCDDAEMARLGQLKGQYMALYYHSATLGKLIDVEHHLTQVERALQSKSLVSVSL